MIFESTTDLLRSVVCLVQNETDTQWHDALEYCRECIYEMHQMSRPSRRSSLSGRVDAAAFERSARAIPHVKEMAAAIRRRDRLTAIDSGNAAIAEMGEARSLNDRRSYKA